MALSRAVGFTIHALTAAALLVAACGGSTEQASNPQASPTCDELAASARTEVDAAITSGLTCSVDADCQDIGFSAGCFDSCSRAVNKTAIASVDAAKARVNAAQCTKFKEQGCKSIIPPCAPPSPPSCAAGRCR